MDDRAERFRGLFDASYQPLLAYARRRCGHDDADDLVAEVLTVAWRRLDDVPTDASLPWLYGVARRTLANQRRGGDRRRRLLERLRGQPPVGGSAADADPAILGALASLRHEDQELLRLAAWEELTAADIAVVLGCSANAAALRLSRARRKLRDAMTDLEPDPTETSRRTADG